jgi:leucyl aminopeptidase (aminopeptidase T)
MKLIFTGPFEPAKLNVGDYRGMLNVGGQFPIGEVFTEARDPEGVDGQARIFAFADVDFMVNRPPRPITLRIEKGRIAGTLDSTPEFERVLANIRADEGEVRIRELGFGMNRAFAPDRLVRDIGTLERMCGIHLSLGAKHAVYKKPAFNRRGARHHVDVFVATDRVRLDDLVVFQAGAWSV